ncbi:hypothetical protein ENBRE01_3374, partial [Enteropsectra breve]
MNYNSLQCETMKSIVLIFLLGVAVVRSQYIDRLSTQIHAGLNRSNVKSAELCNWCNKTLGASDDEFFRAENTWISTLRDGDNTRSFHEFCCILYLKNIDANNNSNCTQGAADLLVKSDLSDARFVEIIQLIKNEYHSEHSKAVKIGNILKSQFTFVEITDYLIFLSRSKLLSSTEYTHFLNSICYGGFSDIISACRRIGSKDFEDALEAALCIYCQQMIFDASDHRIPYAFNTDIVTSIFINTVNEMCGYQVEESDGYTILVKHLLREICKKRTDSEYTFYESDFKYSVPNF